MFCDQCGTENRNDRKFCSNCGAKLHDYTKPKENLIMPEEITFEKGKVKKGNKLKKCFDIVAYLFLTFAILFTILSFCVKDAQIAMIVVSTVSFAMFFITLLAKVITIKVLKSKKYNEKKKS